jgi:hypothetical protein
MAITLDYFLKKDPGENEDETILTLVVMDEGGNIKTFGEENIDACSEYLSMRTIILVYDNTIRRIYPYLTKEYVKDAEINRKIFDIFNYLKKQTGHDISLSQLALATLGIDMELSRLPKNYDDSSISEIQDKLEARVGYIQEIWKFGLQNGYVAYYIRGIRSTVEVDFPDSYSSE